MLVSPSILNTNFLNLQEEIKMLNESSADFIHMDIMDGTFVPNISFGFETTKAVHRISKKPLDVHLMIVNPDKYVTQVRDCGAEYMTVHAEACTHLYHVVQKIKQAGMKAGVALNPATPVALLEDIIYDLDLALVMSVNPGFGGQVFIANTLAKVSRMKKLINESGSHALIEVDGGINAHTGSQLSNLGVDILVAGNYVFNAPDPRQAIQALKSL